MDGTIRRVKGQRDAWEVAAEAGQHPDGSRRRLYATVHGTKTEAQRKRRGLVAEGERLREAGPAAGLELVLTGDWVDTWLVDFVLRHRSITTYERYRTVADHQLIPNIGDVPLADLAAKHIDQLSIFTDFDHLNREMFTVFDDDFHGH